VNEKKNIGENGVRKERIIRTDLTAAQGDSAIFLPAISSFYSTYIGKQMSDPNSVPPERMPPGIPDMEMMNFFNEQEGLFTYKWGLYSAGHANLDLTKEVPKEDMIRKRGNHTLLLADSGGFQIAKGVWEGEWNNPNCPKAEKYRSTVLKWLCSISDYSMTLDIPTWTFTNPESAKKSGIYSYDDAVQATRYNHEYFMKHSTNDAKFLNVLQGGNHTEADAWYEEMKEFSDPTKHEKYFKGWAMGGANMADPHLVIRRILTLIDDGLLEEGKQDWMHFLGTSKLEWAVLLTALQRAVRRTHNKNFTISFDCASPFLATANGQIYHETVTPDHRKLNRKNKNGKWSYHMSPTADDKKYAIDTRLFKEGTESDGIHDVFENSPISERLRMKDICIYAPGDLNKIGKEGKTSWDSFSYALMMGHNVWHHINSVQEANRQYDTGCIPKMLIDEWTGETVSDIIDTIFSVPDLKTRLEKLKGYSKFWMNISGARGMGGKKSMNAGGQFNTDKFTVIETEHKELEPEVKPTKAVVKENPLFTFKN